MSRAGQSPVAYLIYLVALIHAAVSQAGVNTWTQPGQPLYGGIIRDLAESQGVLYAGTWGDGVFVSRDAGGRWQSAGLASEFVHWIAAAPTDADTVFAGTSAGLFATHSAGASWVLAVGGVTRAVVVDPVDLTRVYASVDGRGILRSDDRGAHWVDADVGMPPGESVRALVLGHVSSWLCLVRWVRLV